MSSNGIDKVFRDALGEGQTTLRPEAWARVAANLPKAEPKRRTLWWPYAAAASVALAAFGTWWMQAPQPEAVSNQPLIASNQQVGTGDQLPETRNQAPVARNQAPETSSHQLGTLNEFTVTESSPNFTAHELAYLPHMEADAFEESVPLLKRHAVVGVPTPAPEVPRPRYLQLAANVQSVWTAVQEYREAEVPAEVTVEVHVPAPVLQRINQTKMLASNLNQSWSTLQSRRSR